MGGSGGALKTFIAGIVTIGMATAVLSNGRQTIGVVKAVGDAGSGFLGTAISGKA